MKKTSAALLVAAACISHAHAQSPASPVIDARSWLLLDATSGQTIASSEPDAKIEPASLTKMMTAYLVFAAIRARKLDLNQMVNVSPHAWKVAPGSSKMFIEPNKPVKVDDLLYGLLVQSGNDAAVALAEAVAGSEEGFVAQMNREAERMGLRATHFDSPHGLPSPGTYSTSRDLSVLATRLVQDFPDLYKNYDSTKQFTYNRITQPNRNRLLWTDPSVDGIKTGHTSSAGYCLIASAVRPSEAGPRRLISVVIGAPSDRARTQESETLLNWGFQNFDTVKLYGKGQTIDAPQVWKGKEDHVNAGFARDIYLTLPKGALAGVKRVREYKEPLVAPIARNSVIGRMKILADGKPVLEAPLSALEQVAPSNIFGRAWDSVRLWMK